MREIKLLTKLELCNLYGWNVIRHIKDPMQKKKTGIFAGIVAFLLLAVLSYIVALSAGLALLGAADLIPAYLIALASFLILFFDVFKIGGVMFRQKGYDILSALPVTEFATVASRFLRMYVESLIMSILVFVPGFIVYAVVEKPGAGCYPVAIFTMMAVPVLPLSLAVFVGGLITGISSRMRHKSLVEAVLSLAVVLGVLSLSTNLSGMESELSLDMLRRFSEIATKALQDVYPPAIVLGDAIVKGEFFACLAFMAGSLLVFGIVIWIVARNYHKICRNLYSVRTRHDYRIGQLKSSSPYKAVLVREARRYFASGPYVSNTIIGPAIGAAAGVALLFSDMGQLEAQIALQIPVAMNFVEALPLLVASVTAMMNAVCISVSMEGKEWWIVKSLPLPEKMILDGKLFFNLLLIAPFFTVAEICLMIALRPSVSQIPGMVLLPVLLIVFSCVFGLRINLLFPKMDWENETIAVKQSASSLLGGLGGVLLTLIFVIPVLFLPLRFYLLVCLAECVLLLVLIRILYKKNIETKLETI